MKLDRLSIFVFIIKGELYHRHSLEAVCSINIRKHYSGFPIDVPSISLHPSRFSSIFDPNLFFSYFINFEHGWRKLNVLNTDNRAFSFSLRYMLSLKSTFPLNRIIYRLAFSMLYISLGLLLSRTRPTFSQETWIKQRRKSRTPYIRILKKALKERSGIKNSWLKFIKSNL